MEHGAPWKSAFVRCFVYDFGGNFESSRAERVLENKARSGKLIERNLEASLRCVEGRSKQLGIVYCR